MSKKFHYIIPMAGRGSRFKNKGYDFPKPLIEVNSRPLFFWAVNSIKKFSQEYTLTFIVLKEHQIKFKIKDKVLEYFPNSNIISLDEVTKGAVITSMLGAKGLSENLPCIFNDCDHMFKSSELNDFLMSDEYYCDGGILTFKSNEDKFSYVQKNQSGDVILTKEKEVISDEAICGCYYFNSLELFLKYSNIYLKNCQYSEFFMSGVYNELIKDKKTIKTFKTDFHTSFGTPEELEKSKNSKFFGELL